MTIRILLATLGLCVPAVALAQVAEDALVIFKDGFTVTGKVRQQRTFDVEDKVRISVPHGFLYIDDQIRRIVFTPTASQVIDVKKTDPIDKDHVILTKPHSSARADKILPGWQIEKIGEFNKNWERQIKVNTQHGSKVLFMDQRIIALSSRFIQLQTLKFQWAPAYHTREFGGDYVRSLLEKYFALDKKLTEPEKREKIFQFLYKAGMYEHANKELDKLLEDFPDQKSVVEPHKQTMKKLRVTLFGEEIERLHQVGQHEEAQKGLDLFFKSEAPKLAPEKAVLELQSIKNKYDTAKEKMRQAEHHLKELPGRLTSDPGKVFATASRDIAQNLHIDALPRLETFLVYAQQHERELKEKGKASQPPEEVLSLALTGWMRGDAAAETDPKIARALWQLRSLLLDRTATVSTIAEHCKTNDISVDGVAQVIPHLPPPEPVDIKAGPMKLQIEAPEARGGEYWVQVPPEYHPSRTYPVLIVLHAGREKATEMMGRWSDLAARNGYILVAPAWGGPRATTYDYDAREHQLVLDCLRDLRRRFSMDSDRVFRYGREQGGLMAYDVGLSHPDQFAGVLPQNGGPNYFPLRYWPNAQYLPFYVVDGDFNGSSVGNRQMFKQWIRWQYPCIYVEYKGRGSEWFPAELPVMFDWMNRKRRVHPTRELGRYNTGASTDGEEFKTMRECDNRFYWLTTGSIVPSRINAFKGWSDRILPATLQASILSANQVDIKVNPKDPQINPKAGIIDKVRIWNQINLRTQGVKQVTIWLGPNMIDFTKPVVVRHNTTQMGSQMKIQPSLQTMLEDFLHNWDKQRLFFAKIDLKV